MKNLILKRHKRYPKKEQIKYIQNKKRREAETMTIPLELMEKGLYLFSKLENKEIVEAVVLIGMVIAIALLT